MGTEVSKDVFRLVWERSVVVRRIGATTSNKIRRIIAKTHKIAAGRSDTRVLRFPFEYVILLPRSLQKYGSVVDDQRSSLSYVMTEEIFTAYWTEFQLDLARSQFKKNKESKNFEWMKKFLRDGGWGDVEKKANISAHGLWQNFGSERGLGVVEWLRTPELSTNAAIGRCEELSLLPEIDAVSGGPIGMDRAGRLQLR